jgi:hypothetical protein
MSKQHRLDESIVQIDDFKISNFPFGSAYFVLATSGQIIPDIFDNKEEIRFINCPFKEAIKVTSYKPKKRKKRTSEFIEKIGSLREPLTSDHDSPHFDNLIPILFDEIKTYDTILIESTGLSSFSVLRLLFLCKQLVTTFSYKKILITDVSNVHANLSANIKTYLITDLLLNEIETVGLNDFTGRKAIAVDFKIKGK